MIKDKRILTLTKMQSTSNDYNRLKNAVSATDVTAVRRLIKGGVSVNSRSAAQDWVCNLPMPTISRMHGFACLLLNLTSMKLGRC